MRKIGLDLVQVSRVGAWLRRYPMETLTSVFAPSEVALATESGKDDEILSLCFACKECVVKILGCALGDINLPSIRATVDGGWITVTLHDDLAAQSIRHGYSPPFQGIWRHFGHDNLMVILASV